MRNPQLASTQRREQHLQNFITPYIGRSGRCTFVVALEGAAAVRLLWPAADFWVSVTPPFAFSAIGFAPTSSAHSNAIPSTSKSLSTDTLISVPFRRLICEQSGLPILTLRQSEGFDPSTTQTLNQYATT